MTPSSDPAVLPAMPRPRALSPRQLEANRNNAKSSTGPRTEEGKQTSRLNARRHDLTGHVNILPDAERTAVEDFCKKIIASLAPGSDYERQLARAIAEAQWRLARARAIEDNFFALHISSYADHPVAGANVQIADALHQARAFADDSAAFDRLTLYEQRIQRAMAKNVQLLTEAKQQRLAAEAKAFEEAQLLRHLTARKGETFDIESEAKANNGFVFSIVQIDTAIERSRLLSEARRTRFYPPVPPAPAIQHSAA